MLIASQPRSAASLRVEKALSPSRSISSSAAVSMRSAESASFFGLAVTLAIVSCPYAVRLDTLQRKCIFLSLPLHRKAIAAQRRYVHVFQSESRSPHGGGGRHWLVDRPCCSRDCARSPGNAGSCVCGNNVDARSRTRLR